METDDVVGWYRTFEAMSHSGVRFRAPSGESDWRAADAISAGADAARLYHAAPETLGHTGIAMLPTLPFWDDRRRRLLVRAPRAGGTGGLPSTPHSGGACAQRSLAPSGARSDRQLRS